MALFDRRLLAYFDDGLGAGSATLFDRIVEYQKDLGEIERELKKYKMLLGDREVQCKIRDPDRWIRKNTQEKPKTIKERYRQVAAEIVDVEPPEEEFRNYRDRRASTMSGKRVSIAREKARVSRPSIHPRQSVASTQHRASVAAASKALAVWVQIDTIYHLPTPRAPEYVVRACWLHHPNLVVTTEAKPLTIGEDGDDVCVVRQQLKLEAQQNAQTLVISVHRRGDDHGDKVGFCELDVDDPNNHEANRHTLRDHLGNNVAELRLRLARPGTSHAPGTSPSSREGIRQSRRLSLYTEVPGSSTSTSKRQSIKQRRSTALSPLNEGTTVVQEPSSHRGSVQVVTQDPVALESVNPQAGRLSGVEAAKALARSTTSTPAVSEVPNSSIADVGSHLDDLEYDDGEEGEEDDQSMTEEIFEEDCEEELQTGDEEVDE